MNLDLSPGERAFAEEAGAWLAEHVPAEPLPSMDTAEQDLGLWLLKVRALVGAWVGTAWHRDRVLNSLMEA